MNRFLSVVFLFFFAGLVSANRSFCFRVYLNNKGESTYSLSSPEKFLSQECVERRLLHEIFVDESDIPISSAYLETLQQIGTHVVTQSKWMKTVVVESQDSSVVEALKSLSFVDSIECVWNGEDRMSFVPCEYDQNDKFESSDEKTESPYGEAETQINFVNGIKLHEAGYRGKGIRIAVIDAGFMNVNRINAFSALDVIGTHNIVFPEREVYCEDDHGTKVLSCLAANLEGVMIGTAPDASYLLIKSEDTRGESPIEEDFWAAAVEYADSIGVDIISSSLGYYKYDSIANYYTPENTDGKTVFISRVAEIAAQKGLLIFCSAGNEGNSSWEKVTFPADAPDIITVGAVTEEKERSSFSSIGMTADYRIKPDIVVLGSNVCVIGSSGNIQKVNGTSFSTPIIAGLGACLLQAFPLLTNKEIIELIKQTASQANKPDAQLGYGIPDMFKAYTKANNDDLRKH